MNRETLIAIFLGFTGGILVAFLLITVPKKLPQAQKNNTSPTPAPEVAGTEDENAEITLTSPEEGTVVAGEEADIEGTTVPNSKVIISGPADDIVVDSDDSGSFKSKINVYEGYNQVNIAVYTPDGQTLTLLRNIFATRETL